MPPWHSIGSETGVPKVVPAGAKVAYLQIAERAHPEQADLAFLSRKLRDLASLPVVCDQKTKDGKADGITCGAKCVRYVLPPVASAMGGLLETKKSAMRTK